MQTAHSVAHRCAVVASCALYGSLLVREDESFALRERDGFAARLHPRTLLGEEELSAFEVPSRPRERDHDLQGKRDIAVAVLVQAVVAVFLVVEQQRCGARLSCLAAAFEKAGQSGWIAAVGLEPFFPAIRDPGQRRVKVSAQTAHERRQRVVEVAIVPLAKAVPLHVDEAAEEALVAVRLDEGFALGRGKQARQPGVAPLIEVPLDARPIELRDPPHLVGSSRRHGEMESKSAPDSKGP